MSRQFRPDIDAAAAVRFGGQFLAAPAALKGEEHVA
jgi:hypothetical protein